MTAPALSLHRDSIWAAFTLRTTASGVHRVQSAIPYRDVLHSHPSRTDLG